MKASNNISKGDILDKLEWAFEEGYRLGIDDAKEGIFIDMGTVLEQFRNTISEADDSS